MFKTSREEYFKRNQELGEQLWDKGIPTVGDIADFMLGNENEKVNDIFEFFDNREDFVKMAEKRDVNYSYDESSSFIQKVMSANNEDISKSGYFYKLLMASADDLLMHEGDCGSEGYKLHLTDLDKETFNYRIKMSWVEELGSNCLMEWEDFAEWLAETNHESITIRNPLTCKGVQKRDLCSKCVGELPGHVHHIGPFMALMVTEHATQSALSSMNKGVKQMDVNDVIAMRYPGAYNMGAITKWIAEVVERLKTDAVSARFYEIAIISRIREDHEGPFVSSLRGSINHSPNIFASYIFKPSMDNFKKMVRKKEFHDNSLKLKIAMNSFNSERENEEGHTEEETNQ